MKNPFIIGDKIYLRAIEADDAPLLLQAASHPDIRHSLFIYFPKNLASMEEFIGKLYSNQETILFMICDRAEDTPVGYTGFFRCDWGSRAAVFFITLFDPARKGKGYGGEATRLIVRYGFETLNLNRIQLHVWVDNAAGVKAYQKAGFQIEGTLRQAMYHEGRYCDFYVMGILREEYDGEGGVGGGISRAT
jgi:RimJ/RimL family protein N-acetyltransferase